MQNVTLTNEFHGTQVTVRCDVLSHLYGTATIYPTVDQLYRIRKALCPVKDCTCGAHSFNRQTHNGKRLIVDESAMYSRSK